MALTQDYAKLSMEVYEGSAPEGCINLNVDLLPTAADSMSGTAWDETIETAAVTMSSMGALRD